MEPPPVFRAPPPLWQFVLLSILMHVLLIALFGAPTGGSSDGRSMWGSMQVELRGLLIEAQRRPAAVSVEDAQRQTPAPTREDRGPAEGAVPLTPPIDTPAAATAPSGAPIVEIPMPFPQLLDRLPTPTPRLDEPPPLRVPLPTEGRDLRPPPRERPAPAQVDVPTPLPLAPAPRTERVLAEPPLLPAPVLQPVPIPAPDARVTPTVEAPPVPRTPPIARPIETAPIEVQAIPVPALQSLVPQKSESARSIEMAPLPEIQVAPAPAPPVQERAPVAPPAPAMPATPAPDARDREPARGPDFRAPPGDTTRPGASRRPGDPKSSDYDPTAPSLDLDAIRKRAGALAREGSGQRAVLPFAMPPVPDKKSKMEQAIENARKPDCRTAYQGMGLLAAVPLIANEFGEGNCTWNK
jgi:hypothetical protein